MEEERGPSQQEVHGNQNATSMYGDASVHIYPPPISSVLPERVWMVLYRRNTFFTGREGLLNGLHERFTRDRAAVLTQGQAINGLGGIGKTQIAVEYAYRYREEYRFVLWANAASQETVLAAYVNIADRLQLPERNEQEQGKIVAAVMHWLATHEEWLLVVDNADELDMVWSMLPTGSMGHLLLTTRDQVVGDMESFVVEPMDRTEGTLLLLRRARVLKAEMELEQVPLADRLVAEQIVAEMDGLPLALDQAGAYIVEVACSLEEYLEAYRQRRSIFLADRGRLTSDHPASVATTWVLSFERVELRNPAATDLLRVCAFLAPDAIPEELIVRGAAHLGLRLQLMEAKPALLQEMIRVLRAYSLVRRDVKEKTLSVHRLVQAVLQEAQEEAERLLWAQRAMLAVNAAFPLVEANTVLSTWPQCERLLPHALLAIQYIETNDIISEEAGRLLDETASYLRDRVRYTEAERLYQLALRIRKQVLGSEHPDMAISFGHLADLYLFQGKYDQAEPLFQQALIIYQQQLGPEHPDTARGFHDLAYFYWMQGKYVQAEPLFRQALIIYQQQLGPEHLDTARGFNDLAAVYREQGKYVQAEPLFQQTLSIYEQQLGPEHPKIATNLINLAVLYQYQEKYGEAESLLRRALSIREQQLGPEHPDVAHCLANLANLYSAQGKYTKAKPLFQRALQIDEQQLGPEHPDVASPLNGLANVYCAQNKYAEAELLYLRALRICEQSLGPQHPQTAQIMYDLARLREVQDNGEEASVWYTRALAIREQTLGAHHPQTMETRKHLVTLLHAMGQHEEAAQIETAQSEP